MKINESYTKHELNSQGLVEYPAKDIKAKVYLNGTKVYFFELDNNHQSYRLYSIVNKRSFFL
ncbi:MAG: hypothetical protein FD155_900 [Bacteroidetes bacterium]|nr:MAG: hypothetical protein FD155_900 [Bacteroidota bacterium]